MHESMGLRASATILMICLGSSTYFARLIEQRTLLGVACGRRVGTVGAYLGSRGALG